MWRRVVFLAKTPEIQGNFPASTIDFESSEDGYMRPMWNFQSTTATAMDARAALFNYIFEGTEDRDWTNAFAANLSSKRITVVSDKLRVLSGDTGHGHFWTYKGWFPINKNIVYKDREDGGPDQDFKDVDPWSTEGKPGAGNLFVMDLYACAAGKVTDELTVHNKGVYYWHEK